VISRFRRDPAPLRPPTALSDGITHGPDGTWAWVVLPSRSTDEVNTSTLVRMTAQASSDLRRLIPPGYDFHFKIQWGRWSGQDYLAREWRDDLPDGAKRYLELGADRIDGLAFPKRLVLLGVRMDVEDPSTTAKLAATARKGLGTHTSEQTAQAAVVQVMARIRGFHQRMAASTFHTRSATTQELAWSLRHDLRRTIDWIPDTPTADTGQVARLKSTQITPAARHVEITTDTGTQFLRLVIPTETGFPATDLHLPGSEWLRNLNILGSDDDDPDDPAPPVEVSIRGRNVPPLEAAKILRDALALTKEQERAAAEGVAQDVPDTVAQSKDVLRERLREVQTGAVGMIQDTPCWIVEAPDPHTLDRREKTLVDFYGGMGINLWAPPNIQDLLWKETVLGDRRRVTEFTQFRPVSTLVGGWFHGGSDLGTQAGCFLAANTGSTPAPFTHRLSDAQLEGKKITSVFLGGSGSGKSTAVMLAVLPEVLVVGAWVAFLDIKGDCAGVADVCELFGAPVTRISTREQAAGSVCPFRYVTDPNAAASMAVDNLTLMLPAAMAGPAESVLRRAANQVSARPHPQERSTAAIIDLLADSADLFTAELAATLSDLAEDPLARPVAGHPTLPVQALPTTPGLVYLKMQDLRWPGSTTPRSGWKPGHRLTVMLVQALFSYLDYMAGQVTGIPKVLALTELHRITRYDFGTDLVGAIARTGRALDTNLLLDTQACAELLSVQGLADQVSAVYCFGVDTDDEADAQARFLGLEPEPAIRARQKTWTQGECLARVNKHIGPLYFDYLDTAIQQRLHTTPTRSRDHAVPGPDPASSDVLDGRPGNELVGQGTA
jgi:hypothetical protein